MKKNKYSPTYLISQAFIGLWRNLGMSVASILVLTACLLVTGSFYALTLNLNYNLEGMGQMNQIVVYVDEACTEAELDSVRATIADLKTENGEKAVSETAIVTKAQALAEEKAKYAEKYPHLFDSLSESDNPYRDSVIVTYSDDADVQNLEMQIQQMEKVENLVSRADVAESVESVKSGISMIFIGFMVVLFVVTFFVIIITIRLAVLARSKEIMIMRYVGATKTFIMTPFVLEGVLIGLFSAIASFFLQNYLYSFTAKLIGSDYDILRVLPFHDLALTFLAGFLLIGIACGALGSFVSLRRYLKV